jgi:hypothetical protein
MSLPIGMIVSTERLSRVMAAVTWTADHLHVPESSVKYDVAVAYVVRHFEMGALSGWDGFVAYLED